MFKFLHTADIHLDSPLLNLDRYDGAPADVFRSATRRAFDNIVELALAEDVDFVLIAGDLYDGECHDFNTPLYFRRKMEELKSQNIRVFICQGNHDAQNSMRKAFRLQLPENVHLFRTDRPETVKIDELKVAVHGQGFAQRAVEDDLSQDYPEPLPGWLNIGLLHTSCGSYEAHDRYAPSSIAGLSRKRYQYWALGHIHKSERLAGPDPWIVYPGNPQGRHIRESGPKGAVLASVDEGRIDVKWRYVDVLRWQTCTVDAGPCDDADAVVAEVQHALARELAKSDDRPLAARLIVTGQTPAHHEVARHTDHWDRRLREAVLDRFDDRVWVEKIKFRIRPLLDLREVEHREDPVSVLLTGIHDSASAGAALTEIRDEFQRVLKQLPTDPRLTEELFDLDDEQAVDALLRDAQDWLTSRLLESSQDT